MPRPNAVESKTVRLWTLQPPAVLEIVNRRGRFVAAWDRIDDRDFFEHAYRWMARQMVRRGIMPRVRPPVWAWHSHDGRHGRPDMRKEDLRRYRRPLALITLNVPSSMVLLSEFNDWHHVLNGWHYSLNEAEADRVHRLEAEGKLTRGMIERSWERIFDWRAPERDPGWCGEPGVAWIQACLPHLDRDWIVKVEHFR